MSGRITGPSGDLVELTEDGIRVRKNVIRLNCGNYQDYEVYIWPKAGAPDIEIPDPCILTIEAMPEDES